MKPFLVTVSPETGSPSFHDVTDSALASGVHQLPMPATPPMPVTEHIAPQSEEDRAKEEPFQLRAGECYLDRIGNKVGPMETCVGTTHTFCYGSAAYRPDGRYGNAAGSHDWDLITHVPPLPTPPVRPEGKREVWINYHESQNWWDEKAYDSKEKAAFCQRKPYGECKQVRFVEFHESQVVAEKRENQFAKDLAEVFSDDVPAYPPGESEWPEKLVAPEGCVWERMPDEGTRPKGSIALMNDGHGTLEWKVATVPICYQRTVVFRAVPAPQWRELGAEDIVENGDEMSRDGIQWSQFYYHEGQSGYTLQQLRQLSGILTYRARTRRPLPPSDVVDPVSGVTVPTELLPLPVKVGGGTWVARGFGWTTNEKKTFAAWDKSIKKDLKWRVYTSTQTVIWDDVFYLELVDEAPPAERKASGVEARVCEDIAARQAVGIKKYGTTVEGNPLPLLEWLKHAYQESLDLPIYLKRAMEELDRKEPQP